MRDSERDVWNEMQHDAVPTYCECDPQPIADEEHENICPACGLPVSESDQ